MNLSAETLNSNQRWDRGEKKLYRRALARALNSKFEKAPEKLSPEEVKVLQEDEMEKTSIFFKEMRVQDRLIPPRIKGIRRGDVLKALKELRSAEARAVGEAMGLPVPLQESGVLFHLHALTSDGVIQKQVKDQKTFYHAG